MGAYVTDGKEDVIVAHHCNKPKEVAAITTSETTSKKSSGQTQNDAGWMKHDSQTERENERERQKEPC